ncbi:MAG: Mut7-C RNAse domain-containing protein [Chthoniobacterales bacterium]
MDGWSHEPLTRRHYELFRRCPKCRQVYWSGSHFPKLQARVARLLSPR